MIFLPDPVNKDHSLNLGLSAWWLVLPGIDGGKYFYDVLGLQPGTLVNSPSWRGTTRPGGFGELAFNATSSQYVDCGYPNGIYSTTSFAFSGWMFKSSTSSGIVTIGTGATSGGRSDILWYSDGNVYYEIDGLFPSFPISLGGWHHFGIDYDGSTVRGYLDGIAVCSSSKSAPTSNLSEQGPFRIGSASSSSRFSTGSHDDVRIYNRSLSSNKWKKLYDSWKFGYVDVLNFIKSSTFYLSSITSNYIGSSPCSKSALLSASGSSSVPIYHSSCDIARQTQIAVLATANVPTYSGTCVVSKQGILSGAATHTAPVYHASAALPKSAVFSGSSTFAVPNYSGTASVSKNCTLSSLGTSAVPTYNGICSVSKSGTFSASVTSVAPGFETTCFVSKAAQFSCSATIENPVIHGACAISKSGQLSSVSTFTMPAYHANASINKGASFSGGATSQAPIFAGSSSPSKSAQVSSAATVIAPVYHADASLTKSPQISSAFSPQYYAACALTVSHIENSSANFSITAKVAVLAISKHPTTYGVGSLTIPPHAAIAVSKRVIFMGHAVNSNPNPDRPFYYVRRRHYIKKTFLS